MRDLISFPGDVAIDELAERMALPPHRWPFHLRLADGIDRALRQGRRGHTCLRRIVSEVAAYAIASDVSKDDLSFALTDFIRDHPLCGQLDRVCLADNRRVSERLMAHVEGWLDVAWASRSARPAARPPTGSAQRA